MIKTFFRRYPVSGAILVFAFLLMVFMLWQKGARLSDNPRSRIISVAQLVEKGTWEHPPTQVGKEFEPTIDKIKVDGKYYSSKPPIYPLLMAGEAMLLKGMTGWNFYDHKTDYLRFLVLLNQILPYLVLLWVAFLFLREQNVSAWTRNYLLLALSLGSLPFGYAVTINNHSLAAVLFFLAFYLVYRIRKSDHAPWSWYFLCGLLGGFAFSVELPGGIFLFFFLIWLFLHDFRKSLFAVAGVLIPVVITGFIYKDITGSFLPTYLNSGLYKEKGGYWTNLRGWDAVFEPKWKYGINLLFAHHGFFSLSPVLLLPVVSLFGWRWKIKHPQFRELIFFWLGAIVVFVFVLIKTHNYGGDCIGLRWFFHFSPLLLLLSWPLIEYLGKRFGGRVLAIVLLMLSVPWVLEAMYEEAFIRGTFESFWVNTFY